MGYAYSLLKNKIFPIYYISLIGQDKIDSPKTSILHFINHEENNNLPIPTIGYNIGHITKNGSEFYIWNVGCNKNIRNLWKRYYQKSNGFIFLINNDDLDDDEYFEEIKYILAVKEWENVPVLFMANTQDINHVLPADVVKKKFGEIEGRKYLFHETYSYDGEGIKDGIDLLINSILNK